MKLYIDTASAEKIIVGIDNEKFETESHHDKSQKLLSFIDQILAEKSLTPKDITEIEIKEGPGSFTGLRVGISVANAFAYVLSIKVNGKKGLTFPKY